MKASDYIVRFLYECGVRNIFELSGGMITHLLNSFSEFKKINLVSMHHEQAAGFAADATGRLIGIPGVAIATSGPGAINLLNGIASCYFDSIPAVFITGQVPRNELTPSTSSLRQTGFQETNIVAMAASVTKQSWQVQSADKLPLILSESFKIAMEGRPGPVLIDIPFDVQAEDIRADDLDDEIHFPRPKSKMSNKTWEKIFRGLSYSERPLILAGNGIRMGDAVGEFLNFVNMTKIPVVHSLLAKDLLPYTHSRNMGLIGSYGNRWANKALAESDFLLVLGSRLDIKQTGSDVEAFTGNKIIYHVDIEREVINSRVPDCNPIVMELKSFLSDSIANYHFEFGWEKWRNYIITLKVEYDDQKELTVNGINPNVFMHQLSQASRKYTFTYTVDTGQNQMWAAQSLEIDDGQRFLTSGGLGSMGYALPAAIGAAIETKKPVVCIVGDAGMQCNIQELQTVVRNYLPIKIVVMNNGCHGMVRQFQETYFNGDYQSTYKGYNYPEFDAIARAYQIPSSLAASKLSTEHALERMWKNPEEPHLVEVSINTMTNVRPKLLFGKPLSEME